MSLAAPKIVERIHRYGKNVHLLDDPAHEKILSSFCEDRVVQPEANRMVRRLSEFLVTQAVNYLFPLSRQAVKTRMLAYHKEASFETSLIDPESRAIVVDLMRAGILPSQVVYEFLHDVLPSAHIRQDHILMNRLVNDKEEVVGVRVSGHKIGGPIQDAFVFIPDPMGATGSSIEHILKLYQSLNLGTAKKFIALHFIVTPEYLKRLEPLAGIIEIFALRLDRGLSSAEVLKLTPGERWEEERGLNDKQYIVPGAGGIGEILNNSFV